MKEPDAGNAIEAQNGAMLDGRTLRVDVAQERSRGGGGRADFAQAGGKAPEKLDQALQEVYNIVAGLSA